MRPKSFIAQAPGPQDILPKSASDDLKDNSDQNLQNGNKNIFTPGINYLGMSGKVTQATYGYFEELAGFQGLSSKVF